MTGHRPNPLIVTAEAWMAYAACRGHDTNIWFPTLRRGRNGVDWAPARAICATCPSQAACLDFAMRTERQLTAWSRDGMYGGYTPRERGKLARGERLPTVAQLVARDDAVAVRRRPTADPSACGTQAGYMRHRRRDEPACPACRHAWAAASKRRQQARRQATVCPACQWADGHSPRCQEAS